MIELIAPYKVYRKISYDEMDLFLFFKMQSQLAFASWSEGQLFKSSSRLFPGNSLGWRGMVLQRRPPTSPPSLFLVT